MDVIHVTRAYEFAAVHSLSAGPRPERTHGHRYRLEITLDRRADLALDRIVTEHILEPIHGQVLERVTGGHSTGECVVEWIDQRLRASALGPSLRAVVLRETAKNRFVSGLSEERYV